MKRKEFHVFISYFWPCLTDKTLQTAYKIDLKMLWLPPFWCFLSSFVTISVLFIRKIQVLALAKVSNFWYFLVLCDCLEGEFNILHMISTNEKVKRANRWKHEKDTQCHRYKGEVRPIQKLRDERDDWKKRKEKIEIVRMKKAKKYTYMCRGRNGRVKRVRVFVRVVRWGRTIVRRKRRLQGQKREGSVLNPPLRGCNAKGYNYTGPW